MLSASSLGAQPPCGVDEAHVRREWLQYAPIRPTGPAGSYVGNRRGCVAASRPRERGILEVVDGGEARAELEREFLGGRGARQRVQRDVGGRQLGCVFAALELSGERVQLGLERMPELVADGAVDAVQELRQEVPPSVS